MAAMLGAGLRGGCNDLTDEQVLSMQCDEGVVGSLASSLDCWR